MGKKRRAEKLKRKAQQRAPLSGRDMLRIFPSLLLRAFIVVMPLSVLMTILGSNGVTLFNNFWVQMGTYLAAYIVFNRFIFGPIRNYQPTQASSRNHPPRAKP
ncbi:hypothetical protein [Meiothermus taiwanensis]|jgi:hypothetical protein|uniref:Uncharacterized protein n=2 Tax=Meiothermus taiwanensis TaxID=172827 RepID=A0A399E9V0_9DEIN|nr:hypothetical protein [Meiothermus taiwanensis]AWR87387.1 hypothetical protein Mtai_v1c21550 [Meiothermus taiwanensis WR-220]KIQ55972.1 hypothetical protein SY28_00900 [Meiothermus taiwanensis]KZK15729.1 hypothetical protein A3962_01465 [Meiothermus taiwanensis]RIH79610.1 hypothetical protein Mcate_00249 [Meiothermus taiwanensis]